MILIKVIKIVCGAVAALFTVAYLVQFVSVLLNPRGGVRGATDIAACLFVLAIAAAITLVLFRSAFGSTK